MPITEEGLARIEAAGLKPEQLPGHIAIIMDGNGRWAQRRGLPRIVGPPPGNSERAIGGRGRVPAGAGSVDALLSLGRELEAAAARADLLDAAAPALPGGRARRADGAERPAQDDRPPRWLAAATCLREFERTAEQTASNDGMILCLAVNYGGRSEIGDAARRLAEDVRAGRVDPDQVDEATFASYLYTVGMSDPDLLIRTAGEMRISNFLLWQISYCRALGHADALARFPRRRPAPGVPGLRGPRTQVWRAAGWRRACPRPGRRLAELDGRPVELLLSSRRSGMLVPVWSIRQVTNTRPFPRTCFGPVSSLACDGSRALARALRR